MSKAAHYWDSAREAMRRERSTARWLWHVDGLAFLPAALEITERPVSPGAKWTARVLLVGFVLILAWLWFGQIDIVVTAGGKLVPVGAVNVIQPAEGGIIRTIRVVEGRQVRAGDTLVELDSTSPAADVAHAKEAYRSAELQARRDRAVLAALDGKQLAITMFPEMSAQERSTQFQLAAEQLTDIRSAGARDLANIAAAKAAKREAEIESAKLAEQIPLLDQQVAANEELLAKGFASKLKVIEMRRERIAAVRDRDAAVDRIKRATAELQSVSESRSQAIASAKERLLEDITRTESEALMRGQELTKASQRGGFQKLKAPIDGIVTQLLVHTIGGVVEAAKPIMTIVPTRSRLGFDAMLANRDAGAVHVGQRVSIRLDAFPHTRFGVLEGKVEGVAADVVRDQRQGWVYPIRITLDRGSPSSALKNVPLSAGLSGTADIRTGRRRLGEILLAPVSDVAARAGRER